MKCLFDGFKCPYYKEGDCKVDRLFNCEKYWRYNVEEREEEMVIYVGYIKRDCAIPLFMSTNRNKVKERLKEEFPNKHIYIVGYIIKGEELIELDCD